MHAFVRSLTRAPPSTGLRDIGPARRGVRNNYCFLRVSEHLIGQRIIHHQCGRLRAFLLHVRRHSRCDSPHLNASKIIRGCSSAISENVDSLQDGRTLSTSRAFPEACFTSPRGLYTLDVSYKRTL